jgi:hypothetical protein
LDLTIHLPEEKLQILKNLSKEFFRTVEQECMYRLEQGLRLQKHISDGDTNILKIISQIYIQKHGITRNKKGTTNDEE